MTKRERVFAAINHKNVDKIPKGELCIEGGLANRLLSAHYPLDYQHFERDLEIRKLLDIDFINLGDWPSVYLGKDEKGFDRFWSNYRYEYETNGINRHIVKPAISSPSDCASYRKPDIGNVNGRIIKQFREESDLFVFGQIGGPVSMLDEMIPMEDFFVYCLTDTRDICVLAEKVLEYEVEKACLFIDNGADAIIIADDIAYNTGAFLPPEVMKTLVYPNYIKMTKAIKSYKSVPVILHSDGDLRLIMDDIAVCGFDGLHSIQPSAGMDIAYIKEKWGKDLCLIGNIDLDYLMTRGSPNQVRTEVFRLLELFGLNGGYMLSTCNTLIDAIPDENALAMYGAAEDYYNRRKGD